MTFEQIEQAARYYKAAQETARKFSVISVTGLGDIQIYGSNVFDIIPGDAIREPLGNTNKDQLIKTYNGLRYVIVADKEDLENE